ncbi:MAG TPA: N-acetyltransferase [Lachnospiraceae bacterium]|nr:N-acetyltransferase [Lachnospiraceae bacterium]
MEQISIQQNTAGENDAIHRMLQQYNARYMRDFKEYNFHISERGKPVAGIVAESTFDTLEVEFLFVKESCRGKGYGRRLLAHVEELALRDGLKRVLLNTYSFQAPGFYRSLGYTQLLEINPCFGEYSQFYFMKELSGK